MAVYMVLRTLVTVIMSVTLILQVTSTTIMPTIATEWPQIVRIASM